MMPLPIHLLKRGQCRWPVNMAAPKGHLFCGAKAVPHRSYCAEHQAAARGKGTAAERLADRDLRAWAVDQIRQAEAAS